MTDDEKKIIFVPFAFDRRKQSGINISNNSDRLLLYLKNATNALVSAKIYNKECTVALVTNLESDELPENIKHLLIKYDIRIFHYDYDRFVFPDDYGWSLAFYKLCSLSHLIEQSYEYYLWLDADVWVQGKFDAIWEECQYKIMLYDINHGLNVNNYKVFCKEVKSFIECSEYITNYGGEFFAANKCRAQCFISEANNIYNLMLDKKFITSKGDEFITSICANTLKTQIKNASPYICRYWTCDFRLVSTSYQYNRVLILHIPDEKEIGMLKLFDKYVSREKMATDKTVWRILGLSKPHKMRNVKVFIIKLFNKLKGAAR